MTLEKRIEATYDEAYRYRNRMAGKRHQLENTEETVKVELGELWANAKNNDVRKMLVWKALEDDVEYHERRAEYRLARDKFRLSLLEIDRLKLLVELRKAES